MQLKIYEIKWFSLITKIDIELPSFTPFTEITN